MKALPWLTALPLGLALMVPAADSPPRLQAAFSRPQVEVGDRVTLTGRITNPGEQTRSGRLCAGTDSRWLRAQGSACQNISVAPRSSKSWSFPYLAVRPSGSSASPTYASARLVASGEGWRVSATARVRVSVQIRATLQASASPASVALGQVQAVRAQVRNPGKWPWQGRVCDIYTRAPSDPAFQAVSPVSACQSISVPAGASRSVILRLRAVGTKRGSARHRLELRVEGQLRASRGLTVNITQD